MCKGVKVLWISQNKLTTIPTEITNIKNIQVEYLGNPIEYISPQVIKHLKNRNMQKIYNDN
jgi:hypothetical protein